MEVKLDIIKPCQGKNKRQLKGTRRRLTRGQHDKEKVSKLFYELFGSMDISSYRSGNDTECSSKDVLEKAQTEWRLNNMV